MPGGSEGTAHLETAADREVEPVAQPEESPDASVENEEHENMHGKFMHDVNVIFTDISNNKKTFAEYARETIVDIFKQSVDNEKKKNGGMSLIQMT